MEKETLDFFISIRKDQSTMLDITSILMSPVDQVGKDAREFMIRKNKSFIARAA